MLNFLITRLSASQPCRGRALLGFLHPNASSIVESFASVVELSDSNQAEQKQEGNESFTLSYLMKSCGLSAKVAIEVSKRVHLKDPENPDSVLNLFRSYGFSETHISKLVKYLPLVLLANPEKTLLPKLRFFESIGVSSFELPGIIIHNPVLLNWSLEKNIMPRYEALKSVLDPDSKVNITSKRSGWDFLRRDVTNLVPNIKVLREHGMPQSSVTLLLTDFTGIAFLNHAKFAEIVKFVKEVGIEPFKANFIHAIYILSITKKSTWESKLDIFERCGWSRDVTLSVFRKFPHCMLRSEEKITSTMKFLVDETDMTLEDIAKCPAVLGYSLEQRIIPRSSVVKILKMKGLFKNCMTLSTIFTLNEKKFLEKFVIRFQGSVPQLFNIYKGHVKPLPEAQ